MAKTHKSNYLIWGLIFAGVAGILIGGSTSSSVFGFQIQPLALSGGNVELPDILCNIKSTVRGLDSEGRITLTDESTPFEKHPKTTFSLVGGATNAPFESFTVDNKMRCDFINGATFVPMTVADSDLTVVIYAKDATGNEKQVWNKTSKNSLDVPIVNNHEEVLSSTSASVDDILKYIEAGDYESTLRFVTYGTVTLFYDGYDYVEYDVVIPDNKIESFITLDVTKDITGQGEPPKPDLPPTEVNDPTIEDVTGTLLAFQLCASTLNIDCLTNQVFLPYYLGIFGSVILLGAITTRKKPMFDQLGNRLN